METLYDKASLILNPGIYDTGKVYCTKPLDGSGDLTFTRASSATRVGPDGLIEKVRTNLLLQSNSFDTTWTTANASVTGGQSGYDGSSDAWLLNGTGSGGRVQQNISASGVKVFSVYAKAGTTDGVVLRVIDGGSNPYIFWSLVDGSYQGSAGGGGINPSTQEVTNVGGGWYRFQITTSTTASQVSIYTGNSTGGFATGTIYIQDAQLETGDIATDYIATTTAAVSVGPVSGLPRLDYSGGASCPRLLLEPQRTNSFTYSEQFDNADWANVSTTITANSIVSPDGYQNADKAEAFSSSQLISQTPSLTAGQPFVFSVFAKAGNWGIIRIGNQASGTNGAWFNLNTGTAGTINGGTSEIIDYGNGWFRLIAKFSSFVSGQCFIGISDADGSTTTPAVGSNLYLWGAMLEQGSYATSYIPTLDSAVTRLADAAYKTGISSLIGQTEGTFMIDLIASSKDADTGGPYSLLFTAGGVASNFQIYTNSGVVRFYKEPSGFALVSGVTLVEGQRYKIAYAYKSGDYAFYINGVQVNTSANSTVPAVSEIYINQFATGTFKAKNNFNQALLFKTRLTNAQLAELTTL